MKFDGRKLAELREKAGLSVRELHAKMAGNGWQGTEMTVRNLELGRVRMPQPATLKAVAEALRVPESVFFGMSTAAAVQSIPTRTPRAPERRSGVAAAKGKGQA